VSFKIEGADNDVLIMSDSLTDRITPELLMGEESKQAVYSCEVLFDNVTISGALSGIVNKDQSRTLSLTTKEDTRPFILGETFHTVKILGTGREIIEEINASDSKFEVNVMHGDEEAAVDITLLYEQDK